MIINEETAIRSPIRLLVVPFLLDPRERCMLDTNKTF